MEFTCTGFNCYDCPFDDCIRSDEMVDGGEIVIREKKKYKRPVKQLSRDGKLVKVYESPWRAHLETGITSSEIYRALQGKRGVVKGYLWTYV